MRLDKFGFVTALVVGTLAVGCGASFPAPTQRLADAESAHRSAAELGAASKTEAQLNLKLAEEQIGKARAAMKEGDNKRADALLIRAKADAELSVALVREHDAKVDSQKATDTSADAEKARANGAK